MYKKVFEIRIAINYLSITLLSIDFLLAIFEKYEVKITKTLSNLSIFLFLVYLIYFWSKNFTKIKG